MRYIKKTDTPDFFIKDTKGILEWKEYGKNKEKKHLREYILENEQNYLCIYCEGKIDLSNSHLEHIKPKFLDKTKLTFNYKNIVVSCNGICYNEIDDKKRHTCGHIKDNNYDEAKFLDPTRTKDIRTYFIYDYDEYKIQPSEKNDKNIRYIKAKYMIDLLKLNDRSLKKAREKALDNFIKKMKKIENIDHRKNEMKKIFDKESIAFISFLKYKYEKIPFGTKRV